MGRRSRSCHRGAEHDCCHAAGAAAATRRRGRAHQRRGVLCPMCPGVESPVPASCRSVAWPSSSDAGQRRDEDRELVDMRRRFWIALALSVPLVALEMASWRMLRGSLPGRSMAWAQLLLATPVVVWCGWPLLAGVAFDPQPQPEHVTLIGLGVTVAYGFSVVATLAPDLVPAVFRHDAHATLYFESQR